MRKKVLAEKSVKQGLNQSQFIEQRSYAPNRFSYLRLRTVILLFRNLEPFNSATQPRPSTNAYRRTYRNFFGFAKQNAACLRRQEKRPLTARFFARANRMCLRIAVAPRGESARNTAKRYF